MRRNWTMVSCLALAIIFVAGLAQARSEQAKQITCTGKVVDAQGQPVADVKIKLYKVAIETTALSFKMELAQQSAAGADGTFTINSEVIDDQYSNQAIILADKKGLALGWDNWRLRENANVEIVLVPPEVLAGTVVDEDGGPIEDAEVGISFMLVQTGGQPRYLVGYMSLEFLSTRSDAEGKFSFSRIPAEASAEFLVKKPGRATVNTFNPENYQGQSLQFSPGQTDIKLIQPIEAKIEGIVVEKASGRPVADIKIMVSRGRNQPNFGQKPVVSKEDGTFSIDGLAPGKHILQIVTPREKPADWITEPVEVLTETGKTKSGVKVELSKGGLLEVVITEAVGKQPVEQARVSIRQQAGNRSFGALSDKDGIARIRLVPGEYQMSGVYKQGYSRQGRQETITIEDGKTERIEYELAGQPKITGIVRNEKGDPVKGVKLKICPMGGREDSTTNAEGKFEVTYDPGGWPSGETPVMFLVCRYEEGNLAAAVQIDEDAGELNVTLKPGVTLTGNVMDPEGKGIANARINTMLQGPRWGSTISSREPTMTDDEGKFEIMAIPAEHKYNFYTSAEGYGENRGEEIDTDDAVDNRLDVGTITLAVANLSVSGVVVDDEDKPVAGADVSCYGDNQPSRRAQTDTDGKFTLENVCAGRIRLSANKSGTPRLYGYIETEGGATDVKVVISERPSSTRYVPKRPPSLVGRPLPELKNLKIDLSPADFRDKMLLVCFFDMEQRPSRYCIRQLAKQAEQLKQKGVTVVAVHASKVDENTLNEWAKENNIPLPIGMVQGDVEKSRFTWGVRSLPWLILTDQKHVVRAGGFALAELDDKIKEINDAEE